MMELAEIKALLMRKITVKRRFQPLKIVGIGVLMCVASTSQWFVGRNSTSCSNSKNQWHIGILNDTFQKFNNVIIGSNFLKDYIISNFFMVVNIGKYSQR